MRRFKQRIPETEAKEILKRATNGVLCLIDLDNQPYGVPMSFIYDDRDSIYFHCALHGKKIDCIKQNPNACFTIIDQDEIHPEEFTTYFKSVMVEGTVRIIDERNEIIESLKLLSAKYSPGIDCIPEIEKGLERVLILKLQIRSISGKQAIELTKSHNIQ